MLLQFSVSNYRAFKGLATLNFAASRKDKSLSQNVRVVEIPGLKKNGQRWLKGVAVYGPNASGKSTLLDALNVLATLVKNSAAQTDPKKLIESIIPFGLSTDEALRPTAFAIGFVAAGIRFEYRVAANRQRIVHESLRAFRGAKEQTWFERDWHDETNEFRWGPDRPVGVTRRKDIEERTLPNVLYLSKSIAEANTELEIPFRWFSDGLQFIDVVKTNAFSGNFSKKQIEGRTELGKRIVEILRHADIGVTDASLEDGRDASNLVRGAPSDVKDLMETMLRNPQLMHLGANGVQYSLPWASESAGTKNLFAMAGPLLNALATGQTAVIDELETSMHPLMVRELLKLFFSENENPTNAQILFTTHNPLLLDPTLLRRDQVWFADKDDEGVAHLYPLTDYQPRKGESLVRGYLSGRYGAVPFVPEGLLGSFPAHEAADSSAEESSE